MSLIRKFNAAVPFDDEPTGFYGICRETFEHLALEEEAAAENEDVDIREYPTFGSSDDDYETVVKPFYNAWSGFSTAKSFSWKDKYRLSDAPDRRVRRLMEKENKKMRDDAIREFNDAINFLVSFVRKRDPRYLPNSQSHDERQASLRNAAAAQAARSRAANQERMAEYEVPEWAQSRSSDNGVAEGSFSESEEEEIIEILECVVCNKSFKSEKQLEAHERSKKHIKAVQQLKRQMKREGVELRLEEVDTAPASKTAEDDKHDPIPEDKANEASDNLETLARENPPPSKAKHQDLSPADSAEVSDDGDYAPRDVVEERLTSSKATQGPANNPDDELSSAAKDLSVDEPPQGKKMGKAKAKRAKKAAAAQAQQDEGVRISPRSIFTLANTPS